MNYALINKALRWIAPISAVGFILLFWQEIFFLFLLVIVTPIALFFEQDYHPWEESGADLAATRESTRVIQDSTKLRAAASVKTGALSVDCAALTQVLGREPSFLIPGSTYCKIRVRTACACSPGQNWFKIHITRGGKAGSDGWVCEDAIGPSVTLP